MYTWFTLPFLYMSVVIEVGNLETRIVIIYGCLNIFHISIC